MKDLMLDSTGDLLLTEDGDVAFTDSILQAIYIRLKWFENEWALGPTFGVPYYEEYFKKNPSKLLIEQTVKEAILGVEEVDEVTKVAVDINSASRTAEIRFTAVSGKKAIEGRLTLNV